MRQIKEEMGLGRLIKFIRPEDLKIKLDVKETGQIFFANAYLKAKAFADKTGLPTIADDSGLVVEALDGKPGIYSARWAETNEKRIAKVLDSLKNVPPTKRQATFITVMVFYDPQTLTTIKTTAKMEGLISQKPKGKSGFGYDPIMFIPALNKTVAELTAQEKNQLSHRGQALRQLLPLIVDYFSINR